jgi:hypothetical protein
MNAQVFESVTVLFQGEILLLPIWKVTKIPTMQKEYLLLIHQIGDLSKHRHP